MQDWSPPEVGVFLYLHPMNYPLYNLFQESSEVFMTIDEWWDLNPSYKRGGINQIHCAVRNMNRSAPFKVSVSKIDDPKKRGHKLLVFRKVK